MKQYRYFILIASAPEQHLYRESDLQRLLDEGWQPVRETPMGGAPMRKDSHMEGHAFVFASLILLEKDN